MPAQMSLPVLANRVVAEDHREMVLPMDERLAGARPGQFLNVSCRRAGSLDPLLRRPFSIYRSEEQTVSFLYRVVGRGTRVLSDVGAGDVVDLVGPLGTGFRLNGCEAGARVAVVGGGVGVPPLYFLSRELDKLGIAHDVMLGFATRRQVVAVDAWRAAGREVQVATDDGSLGHHGFVTELLGRAMDAGYACVYSCGPRPMLRAVAEIAGAAGVSCQVAMEEWMGCGIGACLSCVCAIRDSRGVRWARVCREGPVLDANKVVWDR